MDRIVIEIENCKQCPYFKTANPLSSDGFDFMEDWICTKENKTIQGAVEWHEESKIKIPDWCQMVGGMKSKRNASNELSATTKV